MKNTNVLCKTLERSIGLDARITFKLGLGEEMIDANIISLSDSWNMVVVTHPSPFLNDKIMECIISKKGKREFIPKLVKTMMIPVNNIIAFRLLR